MKSFIRSILIIGTVAHTAVGADNRLSREEVAQGWILLFDGKSLDGWTTSDSKPSLRPVEYGALNPHGCGSYMLVTERQWRNFVLKLDFKQSPGCNSGVFFRVYSLVSKPGHDVGDNGLEVAIDDTKTDGHEDTGAIYDLSQPTKNALRPIGEWNHLRLTSIANRAVVELNGERVNNVDFDLFVERGKRPDGSSHKFPVTFRDFPRSGRIGLQDHGSDIWFKNIKLLRLNDKCSVIPTDKLRTSSAALITK